VYLFNPSYSYAYRTTLHDFAPNAFNPTWNAYAWNVSMSGASESRQDR
jgi:hypothetical protein